LRAHTNHCCALRQCLSADQPARYGFRCPPIGDACATVTGTPVTGGQSLQPMRNINVVGAVRRCGRQHRDRIGAQHRAPIHVLHVLPNRLRRTGGTGAGHPAHRAGHVSGALWRMAPGVGSPIGGRRPRQQSPGQWRLDGQTSRPSLGQATQRSQTNGASNTATGQQLPHLTFVHDVHRTERPPAPAGGRLITIPCAKELAVNITKTLLFTAPSCFMARFPVSSKTPPSPSCLNASGAMRDGLVAGIDHIGRVCTFPHLRQLPADCQTRL
jgi:hypothetical protein